MGNGAGKHESGAEPKDVGVHKVTLDSKLALADQNAAYAPDDQANQTYDDGTVLYDQNYDQNAYDGTVAAGYDSTTQVADAKYDGTEIAASYDESQKNDQYNQENYYDESSTQYDKQIPYENAVVTNTYDENQNIEQIYDNTYDENQNIEQIYDYNVEVTQPSETEIRYPEETTDGSTIPATAFPTDGDDNVLSGEMANDDILTSGADNVNDTADYYESATYDGIETVPVPDGYGDGDVYQEQGEGEGEGVYPEGEEDGTDGDGDGTGMVYDGDGGGEGVIDGEGVVAETETGIEGDDSEVDYASTVPPPVVILSEEEQACVSDMEEREREVEGDPWLPWGELARVGGLDMDMVRTHVNTALGVLDQVSKGDFYTSLIYQLPWAYRLSQLRDAVRACYIHRGDYFDSSPYDDCSGVPRYDKQGMSQWWQDVCRQYEQTQSMLHRKDRGLDSHESRMSSLAVLLDRTQGEGGDRTQLLEGLLERKDEVETEYSNLRARCMAMVSIDGGPTREAVD
eukprot:gene9950-20686_t